MSKPGVEWHNLRDSDIHHEVYKGQHKELRIPSLE
jgi:hypothetical protein